MNVTKNIKDTRIWIVLLIIVCLYQSYVLTEYKKDANVAQTMLLNCLNGGIVGTTALQEAVVCDGADVIKINLIGGI